MGERVDPRHLGAPDGDIEAKLVIDVVANQDAGDGGRVLQSGRYFVGLGSVLDRVLNRVPSSFLRSNR